MFPDNTLLPAAASGFVSVLTKSQADRSRAPAGRGQSGGAPIAILNPVGSKCIAPQKKMRALRGRRGMKIQPVIAGIGTGTASPPRILENCVYVSGNSLPVPIPGLNLPISQPPHPTFPLCGMIKSPIDSKCWASRRQATLNVEDRAFQAREIATATCGKRAVSLGLGSMAGYKITGISNKRGPTPLTAVARGLTTATP